MIFGARVSAGGSGLISTLDRLSFGYERNVSTSTAEATAKKKRARNLQSFDSGSALCYAPSQIRPRGCDSLLPSMITRETATAGPNSADYLATMNLPCVSNGTCPYLQFRCGKGHEWKAVPGSPVCFDCPTCVQKRGTKKIYGIREEPSEKSKRLLALIKQHAENKGGRCFNSSTQELRWDDYVEFECKAKHRWSATVSNVLTKSSWCRVCLASKRQNFMQATASAFGGQFLGFVEDSSPAPFASSSSSSSSFPPPSSSSDSTSNLPANAPIKKKQTSYSRQLAMWRCAEGHEFNQCANNIRRKEGSKRKCSWCPKCSKKKHKVFVWEGDLEEEES